MKLNQHEAAAIQRFLRWLQEERQVQLADVQPFGTYATYYPHDSVSIQKALNEYSEEANDG